MRLLIVKTSSMGDVVHAMPVVNDIRTHHPHAQIDWLVEAPFAAIPQMHPGVTTVVPMAWRKWRQSLFSPATWRAMGEVRQQLREAHYDLVLDLQGLVKSALWARQAKAPVAGFDRASVREPMAASAYRFKASVLPSLHAVKRCRQLVSSQLGGYVVDEVLAPPVFGLKAPEGGWMPRSTYAVLIPNASRVEKHWPERHWAAVGRYFQERGWMPVVLWGRDDEQTLAERIAADCDGDVVPFLKVGDMAGVLAGAQIVVGLDTGFTHLAAALGRPTLGIYCDHEPGRAGVTGNAWVQSIGGRKQIPGRADVLALLQSYLNR